MASSLPPDDLLRKRFHIARLIVDGPNSGYSLSQYLAVEEDIYLDARAAYVVLRLSGEGPAKTAA